MNIIDLRQTTVRQLEPLLEEEASHWRDELHWDYRGALDLIKRFLEATRSAARRFRKRHACGIFFLCIGRAEGANRRPLRFEQVSAGDNWAAVAGRDALHDARGPATFAHRGSTHAVWRACRYSATRAGISSHTRQFMLLELRKPAEPKPAPANSMRLDRWSDRFFEPCAKLIYLCYADHINGEITDQYRSRSGALKFLKNIILLPGCGQFIPSASFVLRQPGDDELIAVVLHERSFPGGGAYDADLRAAGVPGARYRADADASVCRSAPCAAVSRADADRDERKPVSGAFLREFGI